MKFIVIVKANADTEAGVMPGPELFEAMQRFNEELVASGMMLAGEGLHPSSKGARIRFENGKTTVTDGPFAETKELIAGFWMIQAASREQVIETFRRCPAPHGNKGGELEIRQVFDACDFPDEVLSPELKAREEELRSQVARLG
jgi:hypothetical protein